MYAVVRTGGKQYRVEAGSMLVVEKLGGEPGSQVTFDRVLLVGDGDSVTVGTPTVAGATVSGTVLGESLGAKIVVFKFKQKVKYRRRTGHRQQLTRVRIDAITAAGKTVRAEVLPEPKPAKPEPKRAAAQASAEPAAKARPRTRGTAATKAPTEAKPARPARKAAAQPAAEEPAEAKPARRARGRAASTASADAGDAGASRTEEKPKPRARRAAKPKTESAKEE